MIKSNKTLIKTNSGILGYLYSDEELIGCKYKIHVVNSDLIETGEKILCHIPEVKLIKQFTMNKPGTIVKTSKGKKGIVYTNEFPVNEKVKVYVLDKSFNLTGEKLLCDPNKLKVIGYVD